jgi:hypothetical protein
MIHTDEDDEFDRIARENTMKGQPYHYDVYVSPSQRNKVIEECAQMCEKFGYENHHGIITDHIAKAIRGMKT